jgi:CubicO group peptidase (beta-lactamase class C family)
LTRDDATSFIGTIIESQLRSRHIAGAVAIAVKDGVVIYRSGYGASDVAQGRPMDAARTVVRLASITKLFTAVAAMQLMERGQLDLDRDVRGYLDFELPEAWRNTPITLRRLLSRQIAFEERIGGIASLSGERADLPTYLKAHWPSQVDVPQGTPVYSNFAYSIVAYAIERVSGERFEDYLHRHIFDPLGMSSASAHQPLEDALIARLSQGYLRSDLPPSVLSSADATIHEAGSTAVCASADDVARFMIALLGTPPASMLNRSSLAQMLTPQVPVARGVVGLGFYAPVTGSAPFIGHEGDTGGFHAILALLPEQGFGFFVAYNSASANDGSSSAGGELLEAIAARYFPDAALQQSAHDDGRAGTSGSFQPSRRNDSTVLSLMALLSQLHVKGDLAAGQVYSGRSDGSYIQVGPPFQTYTLAPWWKNAKLVVPAVAIALFVTLVRLAAWPVQAFTARRATQPRNPAGRRGTLERACALFQVIAIGMAAWLLSYGNLAVRLGEPYVAPFALLMFAFGWLGVLGTGVSAWRLVYDWNQLGAWGRGGAAVATVASMVLALFCLVWRIAGTNLEF